MDYKISEMNFSHIKDIAEIERLSFSHPRSENSLLNEVNNKNSIYYVILDIGKNKAIAYAGMDIVLDEAYIVNIAVLPEYRNKGYGYIITNELIKYCEENKFSFITLEVRVSNYTAINLYEKLGFEKVGIRKNFYTAPNENAYIMTKFFKNKDEEKGNENISNREFM